MSEEKDKLLLSFLTEDDLNDFKWDMYDAMRYSAIKRKEHPSFDEDDLPSNENILQAYYYPEAVAIKVVLNGEMVASILFHPQGYHRFAHIVFFYVKSQYQGRGIGKQVIDYVLQSYPDYDCWTSLVHEFDEPLLNFFINRCGFRGTQVFNEHNPSNDPLTPDGTIMLVKWTDGLTED